VTTTVESLGGLRTIIVPVAEAPRVMVVILHGYAMGPEDLAPFAESMGVPGAFYLPEGPFEAEGNGRAWWPIDQERRAAAMAVGPRDLAAEHPPGAEAARALLRGVIAVVERRHPGLPLVLVGFSQGGMLACDTVLRDRPRIAGLALLSASRIAADEWAALTGRLAGLPVLVSHGTHDPDLGFHAGEAMRDMCIAAGADVTWVPFEGEHGIPLVVWRALRKFIQRLALAGPPD
jgi:phospholipase/carboxylesterase